MKKTSITQVLKHAFAMSLMLSVVLGIVSLFSWYQQHKQVNYILDDYFPKTHLALKLEDNVAAFVNELDRFAAVKNNMNRQTMFKQLNGQLEQIEQDALMLSDDTHDEGVILGNIADLKALIVKIYSHLNQSFHIEQKKQELVTKLQWLHDDFNNEIVALGQELNWQQINLAKQPVSSSHSSSDIFNLQNELQAIAQLKNTEDNIKTEIAQFLYALDQQDILLKYQTLKELVVSLQHSEPLQTDNASIATLQQMVEMLANMIAPHQDLDELVANIHQFQQTATEISQQKANILRSTRNITEGILFKTNENLTALNQNMKQQTKVSGFIIVATLLISLIFIWAFNRFYLQGHLTKRFENLIESVKLLNKGKEELPIQVFGNDEIAEINRLLKHHTDMIKERRIIEQDLRDTQNELIQTAKVAVVGQTMTSLAHEINQPLNAIAIYLFSLKKSLQTGNLSQAETYAENINKLVERTAHIVKGLRQFTKRHTLQDPLQPVSLTQAINTAWELLALRHQPMQAQLSIEGENVVKGNAILLEQIFVNLLSNALEACKTQAHIQIQLYAQQHKIYARIEDNGEGWPLESADKLLQPFYSNKEVGLGLGLTICQRIMQQFNGNLYIASSLHKSAVIILEFPADEPHLLGTEYES
ncbi:ATP-binding protein [Actinobacillus suis]|uniref:histidine kinase n=2 Tax=Actinobacillus suis TaxID=716 RepID=K0G6G5_ACTSU|nr:ATP-binding protein [Actinobacillus suis]AFU19309.1 sensory histidine kinase AtoS [Actinobacillus suis H91-0380]AIJ31448.1 sensory histidine kinase AtoS [Actinobacillus suis ATCC 33415]MCO4166558.1 ATP-binding protein [Actinobacillus suis]MCO4168179.1 ATP-binding protein [Actinobacillus suis]MCQ9629602.1 ATP-binding protein [Actinobacillus suis]